MDVHLKAAPKEKREHAYDIISESPFLPGGQVTSGLIFAADSSLASMFLSKGLQAPAQRKTLKGKKVCRELAPN